MKALLPAALTLLLAACGTGGEAPGAPMPEAPADAVETVRTEPNGDVITEYRVGGQLRVVRVEPRRGPVFFLYDRNGQIISTRPGDNEPRTYFPLYEW